MAVAIPTDRLSEGVGSVLIYYSGTPGIVGGLPEELLKRRRNRPAIMASFAEGKEVVVGRLRKLCGKKGRESRKKVLR